MEENRARRVVDALRDRGIDAHMLHAGVDQFGVRVNLHDGRQAEWDTDGTIGLEAQVMQDGDLVGFVPKIDGSEDFDEAQTVDAIARTDYDRPVATERPAAPPPAPALPREGGLFRRFLGGFREQQPAPPALSRRGHSFLATSGPVMRASSGKVAAMMPRDTMIPPAVRR